MRILNKQKINFSGDSDSDCDYIGVQVDLTIESLK